MHQKQRQASRVLSAMSTSQVPTASVSLDLDQGGTKGMVAKNPTAGLPHEMGTRRCICLVKLQAQAPSTTVSNPYTGSSPSCDSLIGGAQSRVATRGHHGGLGDHVPVRHSIKRPPVVRQAAVLAANAD